MKDGPGLNETLGSSRLESFVWFMKGLALYGQITTPKSHILRHFHCSCRGRCCDTDTCITEHKVITMESPCKFAAY